MNFSQVPSSHGNTTWGCRLKVIGHSCVQEGREFMVEELPNLH